MRPAILLAYPSCFYYPTWMERVDIKSSQVLLASYLAQYFPVEYADFEISIGRPNSPVQIKRYERKVREFLESRSFSILALSCWTSLSYKATLAAARVCRELYPDRLIVVGGYHPTARPHEFLTPDNLIDYVVCGEGELPLHQIAEAFPTCGRPAHTQIIQGETIFPEQFVPYNWELVEEFRTTQLSKSVDAICMFLSRGCPYDCSFCMETLKDKRWRPFGPESAVEQIETAINHFGSKSVGIADACFGVSPTWRKRFLAALVERKPSYWVVFETRPQFLDDEDIKLLSTMKVQVQFGIESMSPRMLLLMNKTRDPKRYLEEFRRISHLMSDHGVLHGSNLIFNHPGENEESLDETFAFIDEEIALSQQSLMWLPHAYMHFPGCELDRNRSHYEAEYGAQFPVDEWWKQDADQYDNAQKTIPSTDLSGERAKLWNTMFKERDGRMRDCLSSAAFNFAAQVNFSHWQDDPRYSKI